MSSYLSKYPSIGKNFKAEVTKVKYCYKTKTKFKYYSLLFNMIFLNIFYCNKFTFLDDMCIKKNFGVLQIASRIVIIKISFKIIFTMVVILLFDYTTYYKIIKKILSILQLATTTTDIIDKVNDSSIREHTEFLKLQCKTILEILKKLSLMTVSISDR
ncbi:hypothetical protein Avbf_11426 [Armadillidium vulgare]|nr:hypothetical protein Avbf_11426 [Armadillidium vulgare]